MGGADGGRSEGSGGTGQGTAEELGSPEFDGENAGELLRFIKQVTGRDLIAESFDKKKLSDFRKAYPVHRGADAMLDAVAKNEKGDKALAKLAEALKGRVPRNTRIELNPLLRLRNLAGRAVPKGLIEIDPFRGGRGLHKTMVEEALHLALFDKIAKFNRGEFDALSEDDVANLSALVTIYEEVLFYHAPAKIQALVANPRLDNNARRETFHRMAAGDRALERWYHAISLDEFVAGALLDPEFQAILKGIEKVEGANNPARKPQKTTIWAKLRELFVKLHAKRACRSFATSASTSSAVLCGVSEYRYMRPTKALASKD